MRDPCARAVSIGLREKHSVQSFFAGTSSCNSLPWLPKPNLKLNSLIFGNRDDGDTVDDTFCKYVYNHIVIYLYMYIHRHVSKTLKSWQ